MATESKPWRPEGWEQNKPKLFVPPVFYGLGEPSYIAGYTDGVEAGADAMLELLRTLGHHVNGDASFSSLSEHCVLSNKYNAGNYLFIPDEEVSNA